MWHIQIYKIGLHLHVQHGHEFFLKKVRVLFQKNVQAHIQTCSANAHLKCSTSVGLFKIKLYAAYKKKCVVQAYIQMCGMNVLATQVTQKKGSTLHIYICTPFSMDLQTKTLWTTHSLLLCATMIFFLKREMGSFQERKKNLMSLRSSVIKVSTKELMSLRPQGGQKAIRDSCRASTLAPYGPRPTR